MKAGIEKALNDRINAEIYSAYLYKAMEMYLHSVDLPGMANWLKVQTQEELAHAEGMIQFINSRGSSYAYDHRHSKERMEVNGRGLCLCIRPRG